MDVWRGKCKANLGAIESGIECGARMCGIIVPVDLLAVIWRFDWRLDLRLLQYEREEDDEDERNGESDCGSPGLLFIGAVKTLGVLR